jgi:hypothetical protein
MVPCLLASLLLLALRLDGLTSITPWIVIAPIWALVGLVLLSVVVTRYLARSANPLSPFFNMTDRGLNNIATMLSSVSAVAVPLVSPTPAHLPPPPPPTTHHHHRHVMSSMCERV